MGCGLMMRAVIPTAALEITVARRLEARALGSSQRPQQGLHFSMVVRRCLTKRSQNPGFFFFFKRTGCARRFIGINRGHLFARF
ncbi:MAG: hypothetical protein JWR60_4181 [Polaromonas sp.]|nr:hypothetical protein [Polaromonas sp.]